MLGSHGRGTTVSQHSCYIIHISTTTGQKGARIPAQSSTGGIFSGGTRPDLSENSSVRFLFGIYQHAFIAVVEETSAEETIASPLKRGSNSKLVLTDIYGGSLSHTTSASLSLCGSKTLADVFWICIPPTTLTGFVLLRGTTVNRTYVIHKNLYISLF